MKQYRDLCLRVRERRQPLPQQHFARFVPRYALTIAPLTAAAVLLYAAPGVASWVIFAGVAGLTQNALGILMHEGAHGFFHRDRRVNDLLANALVCLPVFNTVRGYREPHFDHHRDCCEAADPYYGLYGPYFTRSEVLTGFALDAVGITAVRAFVRRYFEDRRRGRSSGGVAALAALMLAQGVIAAALFALTGAWWAYFVLWVAPNLTIPIAINRLRTFVEHHAGPDGGEVSRAAIPTLLEYLTIAPYGYAFHFEHHLMPEIPYYELAWAHQALGDAGMDFRSEHLAAEGYWRAFQRLYAALP